MTPKQIEDKIFKLKNKIDSIWATIEQDNKQTKESVFSKLEKLEKDLEELYIIQDDMSLLKESLYNEG